MKRLHTTRPGLQSGALAVLCLIAAISACHVGPVFQAPQSQLPQKWATDIPGALPAWPSPDWWSAFNAPELDRLVEQARRNSPDVGAAAYRVREADAQAEIAGAPLLPSVQAGVNVGPERLLSMSGLQRDHVIYQGLINVRYELDFWGKNAAALQSARASANAARFAQQVVWITTSTGVADLYFQSLALLDRLRTTGDSLGHARQVLADISAAERRGTLPRLAVIQQQAAVAGIEALLPPLQGQLAATRNALAILVGVLPEHLQLSGRSLLDLALPEISAGVSSGLLTRRPDIQEAEANLVAANADIRVARAQFLPSFTLPLSGGIESMTVSQGAVLGTVPPIGTYSVIGSVLQPIFQRRALHGRLDQSTARYQQLLVGTYRQAVLSAYGEVETALAALQAAAAEERAQERSAALAQQSARMAVVALRGGTGTTLEVLQSQSAVLAAQDGLIQARLAYLRAELSLIRALGGGWQL